ncbi:MAG: ribonuclease P protein component [Actinomycetia bacterium]|nr:ribonuclease P protein component [Actinomycetes bacterium]
MYRSGSGRRVGGVLVFETTGDTSDAEAGFVAGKRVGNAVARNRAKRRLREAVRMVPLAPGSAYIFVATRDVLVVPFSTLVAWVNEAVRPAAGSRNDRD